MTGSSLASLVKSIRDGQEGILTLHNKDGERVQFDCVYKESVAPNFFIVLQSGTLPDNIDSSAPFALGILDEHKESIILNAKYLERVNTKTLELIAAKSVSPSSLREYFRVDFRTEVVLSYFPSAKLKDPQNWVLEGQTIDISASGVLGMFPEECKKISNIKIEIALTHPNRKVYCFGHVVRTRPLRNGKWHAALHFDQIANEVRDDIITNCLYEQRRQLRENIQTTG